MDLWQRHSTKGQEILNSVAAHLCDLGQFPACERRRTAMHREEVRSNMTCNELIKRKPEGHRISRWLKYLHRAAHVQT